MMTEFSHMGELFLGNPQRIVMIEELQVSLSHYEILSNQKVFFFFLISVWVWSGMWSSCCLSSDLWKCQWWQLACCVVTAFSSITVSPSTLITTLPGFLGQMPCLLKVARCTLGVIFPILFNLVLHLFMLPLFWDLSNVMSIDYGLV